MVESIARLVEELDDSDGSVLVADGGTVEGKYASDENDRSSPQGDAWAAIVGECLIPGVAVKIPQIAKAADVSWDAAKDALDKAKDEGYVSHEPRAHYWKPAVGLLGADVDEEVWRYFRDVLLEAGGGEPGDGS